MLHTYLHHLGCYVIVLTSVLVTVVHACEFPDFMQSNGTFKDWRGQVKSQYTQFTLTIVIEGNMMITTSTDSSSDSHERTCVQTLGNHKYLATQRQPGRRSQGYICLQFLKRSANVVQLKTSELDNSMSNLCDDENLTLDPWIILDKAHVLQDAEMCPLVGGFGVRLYDNELYTSVCNAYNDNAWIESECIKGEGLYFHFRYTRCIPNILMRTKQQTMCAAFWTEEPYSFVVVRSTSGPYMWLLRYPMEPRNTFVAYLMKDMYATVDPYVSENRMNVRLDSVQNIARPVSSLCIDESEACSYWSTPCIHGDKTALTCARTCGVCNATRPSVCSFQTSWQGDWIDATHGDRVAATFEPNILTVYYSRMDEKFHCIRWDEPYSGPAEKYTTYSMLVTEFDNGCHPRYSCVKIVHNAPSPVMFLQLSQDKGWPFTDSVSDPISCNSFTFEGVDETLIPNRYRSKHHKMLYSKSLDQGARCNIPVQDIYNYTMKLEDNTKCTIGMQSQTETSLYINKTRCSSDVPVTMLPLHHHCLESSKLFSNDHIIVTRTSIEPYQIYCWIFPKKSKGEFYLVEAIHCNENTKKRIAKGHLIPLATFTNVDEVTTILLSELNHPTTQSISLPGESHMFTNNPINVTTPSTNSTKPGINPATYASPVVVIAAIIFFVIFQIPCMCKN